MGIVNVQRNLPAVMATPLQRVQNFACDLYPTTVAILNDLR